MTELSFKTNINCSGCLSKVTPTLDAEAKIEKWEVNLESDDRILKVQTTTLKPEELIKTVQKAGFNAELVQEGDSQ